MNAQTSGGVDPKTFRQGMGQLATGVTVVTTRDTSCAPQGLTIGSFVSLSLDPPLVMWSITETSYCSPIFADAEMFAVNVLASDQHEISTNFCKPIDRFETVTWENGFDGLPLIHGAVAWIECARERMFVAGDHRVFIGRVLRMKTFERHPLLHFRGKYVELADRQAA
jgi:flavin reductase (DIM6/NTAB) family NADH-FMN oxidoreductase RutF